jgi:hypothetical protein
MREAVELYRALATRNPDAFRPALAMSLSFLAGDLTVVGQHDEALKATREAGKLSSTRGIV